MNVSLFSPLISTGWSFFAVHLAIDKANPLHVLAHLHSKFFLFIHAPVRAIIKTNSRVQMFGPPNKLGTQDLESLGPVAYSAYWLSDTMSTVAFRGMCYGARGKMVSSTKHLSLRTIYPSR